MAHAASINPGCGTAQPNLEAIRTAEGLVIAPDGTFYFTQPFGDAASPFLGRYRPPYTQPELRWLEIGGKALGITLDPKKNILYVGSRERKKLLAITLTEPPVVKELADVEPTINGVTLGEDGAVYYTDQGGGQRLPGLVRGRKDPRHRHADRGSQRHCLRSGRAPVRA